MLPHAIRIFEYYKCESSEENEYIFPILNSTYDSPVKIENRVKKIMTIVNKDLKDIASKAVINETLTTYVARHTFANVMKRSGISNSIIKETMGHDSEKTTQIYLDSFENHVLDDATKALL